MILCENNLFLLRNDSLSCLLRVNGYGHLEQLHFGAPVEFGDWEALAPQSGLGWGCSVVLEDTDSASSLDFIPLAWSGSGRGDYRESPLELNCASSDFRFVSHRVLEDALPLPGMPQAEGRCETLEIVMEQKGARLTLYFCLFETALTRRAVLTNTGSEPMAVGKCMSYMLDLPGEYTMTSFHGGWIREMNRVDTPVAEARITTGSSTGASSNRHNPGFLLSRRDATEDAGTVYGFNLIYSGNHYASAQRSLQGLTRVMQGISFENFRWEVAPGESFYTPEGVLTWSDEGFNGLSAKMHAFVNSHIVPKYWRGRPRPIVYNSWEGCMFSFDQRKLLHLAKQAKDLGCETFVLDDGWFGKRNDDRAGLGDYNVNTKKLPQGLRGLSDRLHALGMEFGIWVEPESVNPDSDLYRAHPDWALTDGFPDVLGRHQLLLDLTKPEVRDYIVEQVGAVLDNSGATYMKWDMNRHSVAVGAKAHAFILGLYEVLDRIFSPRPQVLLESCSSGGNRFDLGMLSFGPQAWCSDNTDPICRLTIQGNLSYLYPQSTFGAHVSAAPHAQTLRNTPLHTRGNVSFFGCLGYELDLNHLLPVEQQEVKAQTALYRQHRHLFQFGAFRRIPGGWAVSMGKITAAGQFTVLAQSAPGYDYLRIPHLDKKKRYTLISREQKLRLGVFGSLLKHVTPVSLNPSGMLLRTADKHLTLPDGQLDAVASGAALAAGIPVLPAFRGTGYNDIQRTQADFGSALYILEEV